MKKNYLYNLLYGFASFIFPLLTTPYVSRKLGVVAIGEYSFTFSLASYFAIIAVFGCHVQGQREIAYKHNYKEECTKVFYNNMLLKFCMTFLAICLYGFVCLIERKYIFLLMLQGISILAVFFDISWFFQGLEEFRLTLLRNFFIKIAGTIVIFLFVRDEQDLWIYVLCHPLSTLLGNLSLWLCLPRYLVRLRYKPCLNRAYFMMAFELFIPILSSQIYSITDRAMLGFILETTEENGYYEQAQKIMRILMTVSDSLGAVLLPRIAILFEEKAYEKITDILDKATVMILGLTCPMMLGIMVIVNDFIPFFLGEGYEKTITLLIILSPILVISGVCNILGLGVLIPMGRHNKATVATIAGVFINIFLNVLFIGTYFSIGASIASVIAEFVVFVIHLYYAREYVSVRFLAYKSVRYFLIASIMGAAVWGIQRIICGWGNEIKIILSISGAIIVYLAILAVIQDEIWKGYIEPVFRRFLYKDSN